MCISSRSLEAVFTGNESVMMETVIMMEGNNRRHCQRGKRRLTGSSDGKTKEAHRLENKGRI